MVEADGRHQKASRELEAERTRADKLQVGAGCFVLHQVGACRLCLLMHAVEV